jgi:CRP-like cAMP-binding protein
VISQVANHQGFAESDVNLSDPAEAINRFLVSLPAEQASAISDASAVVHLKIGEVLYEKGGDFPALYFPTSCVVSITNVLEESRMFEAATVGREGFAGLPWVLGAESSEHHVVVQVPGFALRLPVSLMLDRTPEFRARAGLYADCTLTSMSQSAACMAAHQVIERCARWLLETADRTGRDKFMLPRQYLGHMLGSSRQSVNLAIEALQVAKLIEYRFDTFTIRTRPGLEAVSCECYETVSRAYERYLRSMISLDGHTPPSAFG